ncbi:unnamed protein product, partial [Didymodactylos carnosus]
SIAIRDSLLKFGEKRGLTKTFCPSEVARQLYGEKDEGWRELMQPVRDEAKKLINENLLVCIQQGQITDIEKARGPIRLQIKK